jgi:hypothetical protein
VAGSAFHGWREDVVLTFVASASLATMAALIGTVLTEFTDAFWNGMERASKWARLALVARCESNAVARHATGQRNIGR